MQDSRLFRDLKWYFPYLKRHHRVLKTVEMWKCAYQDRQNKPPLRLFPNEFEILSSVISSVSNKKVRIEEVRFLGVPIVEANE